MRLEIVQVSFCLVDLTADQLDLIREALEMSENEHRIDADDNGKTADRILEMINIIDAGFAT